MESILEVEDLKKSYSTTEFTLKDVSFSIPYGSIVGFIGENGAGKTTTMGTILGTLRRDDGEIHVFGEKMSNEKVDLKEAIGVVFDDINFSKNLNVLQLGKVFKHIYRKWNDEIYQHYLGLFALPKEEKIGSFSRGMSMKLSLAVALSHEAKLLFLDEATAGLDPVAREEVLEVLLEFVQNGKGSILLSSHITSDIEKIADTLIFIKDGQIILKVSKKILLEEYAVLQCNENEYRQMDSKNILAHYRKSDYIEVLVSCIANVPETCEQRKFSIDDVTLLLMRGEIG